MEELKRLYEALKSRGEEAERILDSMPKKHEGRGFATGVRFGYLQSQLLCVQAIIQEERKGAEGGNDS